jgi:nucleotide-binding universal stress UspA family protein
MNDVSVATAVVVGVDGSDAALRAALWAVDEAVSREVPIRLVYAIDPAAGPDGDPEDRAHKLATAEIAVRYVYTAVAATEKPVKVEIDIMQDHPTAALIRASASASMVCVGAVGLRHFSDGHLGSTAEALAGQAHCPVAIVRESPRRPSGECGYVVAIIDDTAGSPAVLELAVGEALVRHAPLRVVTVRPRGDAHAADRLDRRLAPWAHGHPDLDIESEVVHGRILDYLTRHAAQTDLVVVGPHESACAELFSANGYAVLRDSRCALLVAHGNRSL